MDYLDAFAISAAGMSVERLRVEVAALNLANANTVQSPEGVRYQPLRVVAQIGAGPARAPGEFAALVDGELAPGGLLALRPWGAVEPATEGPRMVLDPGHPYADEAGLVAYPAVDVAGETVAMMSALRAYEANVAAMNVARTLALKALEIGGAS